MKIKEEDVNFYYLNNGQDNKKNIDDMMKKKKAKEREKKIKENKKKKEPENFDLETEIVIQMTNKNKLKKEEARKRRLTNQEQKRQKRIKKIKKILKILVLLGLVIGAIVFAMVSPVFNIKNIEVVNNAQVSSDTIISLSQLKIGDNIFKFNKYQKIKQIKENPYIEDIKIYRNIPNIIKIDVVERVHEYNVSFMGKYAYINNQGYILEISEDNKGFVVINGISTPEEEIEPGKRLNNEDLEKLEVVIKIMSTAKDNELDDKVTSLDIVNKNEYSIYLEQEQKTVHLGDESNLSTKMLYVKTIMEKETGKAGDIYVNGDLNNKFEPYFREKINI